MGMVWIEIGWYSPPFLARLHLTRHGVGEKKIRCVRLRRGRTHPRSPIQRCNHEWVSMATSNQSQIPSKMGRASKYTEIGPNSKSVILYSFLGFLLQVFPVDTTIHPPSAHVGLDGGIPSVGLSWKSPSSWGSMEGHLNRSWAMIRPWLQTMI